ncbi:MAG TPA: hypothetical protein VF412_13575 [Bdellovibrio sp.]|uniref:hypothetical protein n=1 Tax=Bdellovibrio sp. TaxID=28201 RepID=UPI002F0F815A
MKIATVILSLVFAGMFAHAQAPEAGPATGSEGAKMEAPAKAEKKEKKEKKHKKHSKKEKSEKSEEGTATK